MSIPVEGCQYDYVRHVVRHDSGPYSGDRCIHRRGIDEVALADRIRDQYAEQIEQAKELVRNPPPRVYINESDFLSECKTVYQNALNTPPGFELNTFEWISEHFDVAPLCMNFQKFGFNGCMHKTLCKLDENFRCNVPQACAFDGIHLQCIDPSQIESVTLYTNCKLPKYDVPLDSDYIFYEKETRVVEIPLKTIYNPTTRRVTFADHPVVIDHGRPYFIQVKYKKVVPLPQYCICIETIRVDIHKFDDLCLGVSAIFENLPEREHVYLKSDSNNEN